MVAFPPGGDNGGRAAAVGTAARCGSRARAPARARRAPGASPRGRRGLGGLDPQTPTR